VRHRTSVRQRVNRQITELAESALESLEDRVAKIEQSMHGSQCHERSPKRGQQQSSQRTNNPRRENKKNNREHTCATSVSGNDSWKEVMLQEIRDLEAAHCTASTRSKHKDFVFASAACCAAL